MAGSDEGRQSARTAEKVLARLRAPPTAVLVALPAIAAFLLYAHTLGHDFVHDDPQTLRNVEVWTWSWRTIFFQPRSLTYAFHAFDHWLWGDWAGGYRLTNVVLAALAASLAAWAAFVVTRSRLTGLIAGLFFAVHPVHVEVVASFSNRKDILAFIFIVLALVSWIRLRGRLAKLPVTLACFTLAYYSKEIAAIGLLPMLLIADLLLPAEQDTASTGRRLGRSLLHLSPFLAIGLLATLHLLGEVSQYYDSDYIAQRTELQVDSYASYLATSLSVLPGFFRLLVVPIRLSFDYAIDFQERLGAPALKGAALAIAWLVAALALVRVSPRAAFGMLWVILLYLPCIGILPLNHIFLADRYVYTPSFGVCLVAALVFERWLRRSEDARLALQPALALLALLALAGARSWTRSNDWRDDASLIASSLRQGESTWRVDYRAGSVALAAGRADEAVSLLKRAVELQPGAVEARNELGVALIVAGKTDEAIETLREILRVRPDYPKAHHNLGLALSKKKDYAGAVAEFREAARGQSAHFETQLFLGAALLETGEIEEAIRILREACRLKPEHADAFAKLGTALERRGDVHGALQAYRDALRLGSTDPLPHRNLAKLLLKQGDLKGALEMYRVGLDVAPGDVQTLMDMTWFLSTCPDPAVRDPAQAVRAVQSALEREPEKGDLWETLGFALIYAGDFPGSLRALERGLELGVASPAATGFLLAMSYEGLGERERALDWFRRSSETLNGEPAGSDPRALAMSTMAADQLGVARAPRKTE